MVSEMELHFITVETVRRQIILNVLNSVYTVARTKFVNVTGTKLVYFYYKR